MPPSSASPGLPLAVVAPKPTMPPFDLRHAAVAFALCVATAVSLARAELRMRDVPYRPSTQPADPLCVLDVHLPTTRPVAATLVWLHGGGMVKGDKAEANAFAKVMNEAGVAFVSANYRLHPAVQYPAYVDDAAAAVAWTIAHAADFGGDRKAVYAGGYSAGGYLAMLLASDPSRLKPFGLAPTDLRGVVTVSPQVSTHFTILDERGIPHPRETSVVDDAAPLRHASAAMPRVLSFVSTDDMPARAEELAYLFALLKVQKHPDARLVIVPGKDHTTIWHRAADADDPVRIETLNFLLPVR